MKTFYINLSSLDRVKEFESDVSKLDGDFDLVSGKYIIDAKSMMGIFSLDLTKPVQLNIYNESDANIAALTKYFV
jgi:phosphotransferase system HPr-like phosphotransfer protein